MSEVREDHPMLDRQSETAATRNWKALSLALGPRYKNATLEGLEVYDREKQELTFKELQHIAENLPDYIGKGGGVILYGNPGTGKDHALAALLKAAVTEHRYSAMFRDGMALFAESRRAIGDGGDEDLRAKLCKDQILAISDLIPPTGELTDFQLSFVRDIVDRRYRKCLSTWITTNIDKRDNLIARLTQPVFERLRENATVIFFDWESYRTRTVKP